MFIKVSLCVERCWYQLRLVRRRPLICYSFSSAPCSSSCLIKLNINNHCQLKFKLAKILADLWVSKEPRGEFGGVWSCSEVPVLCCNYKSSLRLPCDFDVTRKWFIGSSVFMRFPCNQNKAGQAGRQREVAGLHREAISLMTCRLAGAARALVKHPVWATCWRGVVFQWWIQ